MNPDSERPLNVVIAGVGGQGVLLASRLLCGAAVKVGLKVQALEEHGMAQRGGAVTTQLRVARQEIFTAQIRQGTGHVLLAFEPMEGLRALPYLSSKAVLLVNTRQLPPPAMPGSGQGSPEPSSLNMIEVEEKLLESYPKVHLFDATALAEQAGSELAVNMVLIGGLAALDMLPEPLDARALKEALGDWVGSRFLEVNTRAFELGYEAVKVT